MNIFETKWLELWRGENMADMWFGFKAYDQYVCGDPQDYRALVLSLILFGREYELYIVRKRYEETR